MHSLFTGALVILWCSNVALTARARASTTPGFVNAAAIAVSRKRPRGTSDSTQHRLAAPAPAGVPAPATTGSFTAAALAGGKGVWLGAAGEGRRRGTQVRVTASRAAGGGNVRRGLRMMEVHFHPPEFGVLVHGTVQAVMLGAFAAIIPKINAERIREKQEGMARDEAYAAGLLYDDEFEDEFGYAEGYVCATCDNTNEVECPKCSGKGFFFLEASAMPKKCVYCSGLGTYGCEECAERREWLWREREARRPPRELPPARGDDFPFVR